MFRSSVLCVSFLCVAGFVSAQSNDKNILGTDIPRAFRQVHGYPNYLFFDNPDFEIYSRYGHLQGIQHYANATGEYLVLSGSSDSTAYYVMVDMKTRKVTRYNHLDVTPYDHAGGFQIIGDFLVVGIENNGAKDASKIMFYNLSRPGESDQKPVYTLLRGKEFKSKTAGAVGITYYEGKHIMAVVSWDAATVDFYQSNGKSIGDKEFEMTLVYTWLPTVENKTGWIDSRWSSYQGAALCTGTDGKLYLFAFSRDQGQNEADLYEITEQGNTFSLKKIDTRRFHCGKSHFRNGTGVQILDNGELCIYSTPHQIKKRRNIVNRYDVKKAKD